VARTILAPLQRIAAGGEFLPLLCPPAVTLKQQFDEESRDLQLMRAFLRAERIRDYLAYSAAVAIPIRFVVAGKTLLFPQEFDFEMSAYLPAEVMIGRKDYSAWSREIEANMALAGQLLDRIPCDSPLDRAIDLIGRAITTGDRESSFLYCWRAIETVSAVDLDVAREKAKSGDLRAGDPYIGPQLSQFLRGEEEISLGIGQRCYVTLAARLPAFDPQKARDWYKLRGKVAHAGLSPQDYRDVLSARLELIPIAKACVGSMVSQELGSSDSPTSPT
jgi:hypothetical protein